MQANVKLSQLESSVIVSELNWCAELTFAHDHITDAGDCCLRGEALPPEIPRPDLILAADCVYFEPAFPLLVDTLSELAAESTEILFCYKKRRKVSPSFGKMLYH